MAPDFPWRQKSKEKEKKAEEGGDGNAKVVLTPSAAPRVSVSSLSSDDNGKRIPVAPILDNEDEQFLERLVARTGFGAEEEGPRPALPPRSKTPELTWDWDDKSETFQLFGASSASNPNDTALVLKDKNTELATIPKAPEQESPSGPEEIAIDAADTKADGKDNQNTKSKEKKPSRLSRMFTRSKKQGSSTPDNLAVPATEGTTKPESAEKEWADLSRLLDKLNLSSSGSISSDAKDLLVRPFVQILKDLANGVPTAVDDLVSLLDGRNDILTKTFEKLPSSLQKLVTQLPKKLTSSLAPEILAMAAEAQGLDKSRINADEGLKGAAKFFMPKNLSDLALTPALIKTMLKAILNALKTKFPMLAGTSALWSVAVFLLLFVLWYCHKRGREEREKKEKEEAEGEGEKKEGEADGEAVSGERVVEEVLQNERAGDGTVAGQGGNGELVVVVDAPGKGVPK
ncbi:uncharacterized protein QC761_123610 [Podospora bellae-mahoneyi]|uniref:Uncharacterized protein n=1 Tax=Podospora bellae-mahoneyi TaxID=2093777 RepID=A0ABR0FTD8_9PEZI|nr:hypothetical protein QC761_123610 [Podospora bellae-mahoneyi]